MWKREKRMIRDRLRSVDYNEKYNLIKRARTFDGIEHLPKWDTIEFGDRKSILEIGTHEGQSTMVLTSMFPNATILCCDPFYVSHWNNVKNNNNSICYEDVLDYNMSMNKNNITKYRGEGYKLYKEDWFVDKQFDLIYIDDNHTYKNTKLNLLHCWDRLNVNGIIIFDDYDKEYSTLDPEKASIVCDDVHRAITEWLPTVNVEVLLSNYQLALKKKE